MNWLDAEPLEDGKTVEIVVSMNGGGRKKDTKEETKGRNPWNSGSSSEEWTTSEGEKTTEEWERGVEATLKEWAENSTQQGGKLHEFINQAAQAHTRTEGRNGPEVC